MGGHRPFAAALIAAMAIGCSGSPPATPGRSAAEAVSSAPPALVSPSLTTSAVTPSAGSGTPVSIAPGESVVADPLVTSAVMPVGPNDPDPLNVTVAGDSTHAVSATIAAVSGGTLEASGADGTHYQLSIPPDALIADTNITMTPLASITGVSDTGADLAWPAPMGVDLQPDGLRLYDWATLEITPPDGNAAVPAIALGYEGAGHDLHPRPIQTDPTRIELKLLHFSGDAVYAGDGISIPVDPQSYEPVDWEAQIDQAIAELNSTERARELSGEQPDPNYYTQLQQLMDLYWDKVVAPLLGQIETNCDFARANIHTALSWGRQQELIGQGDDARVAQIMDSLTAALDNCWNEIKSHCLDQSSRQQVGDALAIARQLQLLGADPAKYDVSFLMDSASKDLCGDLFGTVVWIHELDQHPNPSWNAHDVTNESVSINVNMNAGSDGWTDRGSSYTWTGSEHESERQGPCGNEQDTSWIGSADFTPNNDLGVGWDPDTGILSLSLDVSGQMRGREIYYGVPETVIGFGCTVPPYSREISQGGPGSDEWTQEPSCENDLGNMAGKANADATSFTFACVQTDSGPLNDGDYTEKWTLTGTLTARKPPPA